MCKPSVETKVVIGILAIICISLLCGFRLNNTVKLSYVFPGRKIIEGTGLFVEAKSPCTVRLQIEDNKIIRMTVESHQHSNVTLVVNQEIHTPEVRVTTVWEPSIQTTTLHLRLAENKSSYSLAFDIVDGPLLSDENFFTRCLNLDYKGLEEVKKHVNNKKYELAKEAYIKFLRERKNVKWLFDWQTFSDKGVRNPEYDRTKADNICGNLLRVCDISYQFGKTINWSINPTKPYYVEWTWQLNRLDFWKELGDAYWATGDEKYAKTFVDQMRSWVKANPVSSSNIYGDYSRWRSLDAGIRMKWNWPNAYFRFLGSPIFDDESIFMMIKSFWEHADFLSKNHSGSGNWLTTEMNGLYTISVLFPEFKESIQWEEFSLKTLNTQQNEQFYPDGAQKELAPGYHGVALNDFLAVYKLAKNNRKKIPQRFISNLEKAFEYYLKIRMPNGKCPPVNDSGWSEEADSHLKDALEYFHRRNDFKYLSTSGGKGRKPGFTSIWMPWAGWYIMRSGWDKKAMYAHFEVGPYSIGHSHEDKLSFILYGYGDPLLTEGGVYPYDSSEWRDYYVSARSHNVVRVDGQDQNRKAISDKVEICQVTKPLNNRWISNDSYDFGEGLYIEGYGKKSDTTVTHYRALLFLKNIGWLMIDVFTPKDDKIHTYESFFHFNSADAKIDYDNLSVTSTDKGKANLQIIPLNYDNLSIHLVKGQKSPEVQG